MPAAVGRFMALGGAARDRVLARAQNHLERFIATIYRHHGPQGALARTWPTGSTVLWVAVLLAATLIIFYL